MPSANLQGLNIVHPPHEPSDAHDLLLGQAYPDLTAQLDLWTNLAFDSEEPIATRHDDHKKAHLDDDEEESRAAEKTAHNLPAPHIQQGIPAPHANLFDLNTFLAGFGIDSYTAHPSQLQQQPNAIAPSLAQLLALHPSNPAYPQTVPQFSVPAAPSAYTRPTIPEAESYPPSKRSRARKMSINSAESPDFREDSLPPTTTALSPAEDKRRRNTAASARFRLKKKEREAALEGKAKELETKVAELERECEGLRRENGWLKGLVVGVTGAAQGPNSTQNLNVSPPPSSTTVSAGTKRRRDETTA
ncbi:Regulatory protein cys-3 [Psilocybe cubensis]|uniref:Regulatory protein cys-3 n=2 Tax=Psilocybe cubensis TaxID=181762 RepID=A0ACB8HB70_PSICU|nr:Regulatory protein cys-3 [Psilocybe cubensis]KAH9485079.1 Regulatory protein cys-3 [Psilocybe cubensis]